MKILQVITSLRIGGAENLIVGLAQSYMIRDIKWMYSFLTG